MRRGRNRLGGGMLIYLKEYLKYHVFDFNVDYKFDLKLYRAQMDCFSQI